MTAIPLDCPATGTKDGSREFAFADDERVVVSFRHTGDAPVLRQSKFKLPFLLAGEASLPRGCQPVAAAPAATADGQPGEHVSTRHRARQPGRAHLTRYSV
eukprot:2979783-Pleurochrysis_carterae.AAC.2